MNSDQLARFLNSKEDVHKVISETREKIHWYENDTVKCEYQTYITIIWLYFMSFMAKYTILMVVGLFLSTSTFIYIYRLEKTKRDYEYLCNEYERWIETFLKRRKACKCDD
jgi:Ca2+-dependent lipid-binding protein